MPGWLGSWVRSDSGRLLLGAFLAHALLLPVLFFVLIAYQSADQQRQFVSHARATTYLHGANFDSHRPAEALRKTLDDLILSGQADYAEYLPATGPAIASSLNGRNNRFQEDFFHGQHNDSLYYIAAPLSADGGQIHLGFSEAWLEAARKKNFRFALLLSALYLLIALLLIVRFRERLAQSFLHRQASDHASINASMTSTADLMEISGLPKDLEAIRQMLLRREQELAQREARQRAVLETAAEGIVTVNPEGRIESFNKAAEALFDCSVEEAMGVSFIHFLDPREAARFYTPTGEPALCSCAELMGRRHSGQKCQLMMSVSEAVSADSRCFTIFVQDISERIAHEARLAHLATHDALTGLPNRALYHDRLSQVLAHAAREDHIVALLFLDLDRFKYINDSLGHHVGDELLQAAAKRLQSCLRSEDSLARLGGDEFTIILPHLDKPTHAVTVAENIVQTLEHPFHLADKELFISCSIGIAFFPFDGKEAAELSRNADTAMYATKNLGGHGFQFYSLQINTKAARGEPGRVRRFPFRWTSISRPTVSSPPVYSKPATAPSKKPPSRLAQWTRN